MCFGVRFPERFESLYVAMTYFLLRAKILESVVTNEERQICSENSLHYKKKIFNFWLLILERSAYKYFILKTPVIIQVTCINICVF